MKASPNLGSYIEKVNMPNPGVMYGGDRNWLVRDMLYQAQTILPISPGPSTIEGFGVPATSARPDLSECGTLCRPLAGDDHELVWLQPRYPFEPQLLFWSGFRLGRYYQGLALKGMISYDAYGNNMTRGNMFQTDYQAFVDPKTDELTFSVHELKQDNFYMSYAEGSRYNVNLQGQLLYNRTFGDHTVGGMLRTERDYWDSGGSEIPFNVLGFSGRATYDYASRYFAEVNFGYNGSEQFSPEKRFGFFPSAAVGWAVSNESFLQDNPTLTFLKLRASYGKVGNDKMGGARFLYLDDITMGDGFSGSLAAGKGVNEGYWVTRC